MEVHKFSIWTAAWEAYEEGVADAIRDDLATYTDEDYGIVAEDSDDERPAWVVGEPGDGKTCSLEEGASNANTEA